MNILIVGGNGGIGFAVVQELVNRYPNSHIQATYRREKPNWQHRQVTWNKLNASEEKEVESFCSQLAEVDWVINCAGMLHSADKGPEKSLAALDGGFFQQTIAANTLPTLLFAHYLTPKLKRSHAPKFVTISAKVGSIADNQLGGWYSYRASKAALNMFLKTMSIEWRRLVKHGVVLALHPGTTDTALSAPFQANVPDGKLFSPAQVASDLVDLIDKATPDDSGSFWAYNGEELPW